jgi:ABC-type lipoprotein release transport system permease subunit
LLYGINLGDWVVFAGVAIFLAGIAITASYVPARTATQVNPMVSLRNE